MLESFVILLAAHLIADVLLRFDWGAKLRLDPSAEKSTIKVLLIRSLVMSVTFGVLLGSFRPMVLFITFVANLLIHQTAVLPNDPVALVTLRPVRQISHLVVLFALSSVFTKAVSNGWWAHVLPNELEVYRYATLSLLCGLILNITVGATVIGRLMEPFTAQTKTALESEPEKLQKGLENGGQFIGYSERALVMMLVLLSQWEGIGFLLAAKSIIRFGEQKDRMFSEYVLIGTFLSFGWAMLISLITQKAIIHWLP